MRSVSRSLMSRIHTSGNVVPATIVLGLTLLGSQLLARPMSAQQGGGLGALEQRVAALEAANTSLQEANASLQEAVASLQESNADLTSEMAAVKAKTAPISVDGNDFTISGKNVFIVDGSGSTISTTGLGNLTIGYNQLRGSVLELGPDERTGSHNLIVGDRNNYAGYGGFVAGYENTISHQYCSVSGGARNTASGSASSVSGGQKNTASGSASSVSGGVFNIASGSWSSVSGGQSSTASGIVSSVSGGHNRNAPDGNDWAAGSLFEDQ